MKAATKIRLTFLAIVLLTAAVSLISWPGGPTLPWLGRDTVKVQLGLDMQGGVALLYNADVSQVPEEERLEKMTDTKQLIENRINAFGVSEPNIQTVRSGEEWRLSVELPGVQDINEAVDRIGATPKLEFKIETPAPEKTEEEKAAIQAANQKQKEKAEKVLAEAVTSKKDFIRLGKKHNLNKQVEPIQLEQGMAPPVYDDIVFNKATPQEVYTELIETEDRYSILLVESIDVPDENAENQKKVATIREIFFLKESEESNLAPIYADTGLTGEQLKTAAVVNDPATGLPAVSLTFNDDGKEKFAQLTRENVGKALAIYLDGQMISLAMLNEEIPNGEAQISGGFSIQEAQELTRYLKTGALPVSITLISQQNIGPTLGQESIERSLFAGALGLVLLSVFMIVYYRLPGLLGVIALFVYTLIVLAIFKLWPITMTLAGVAGFILSIGMAVDANILIFERMKEELRKGKSTIQSIDDGFARAWTSIRDSNSSSLITCLILYWFGSSLIRGFAITLAIGIAVSVFSAITMTRTFLLLIPIKNPWWYGIKRNSSK